MGRLRQWIRQYRKRHGMTAQTSDFEQGELGDPLEAPGPEVQQPVETDLRYLEVAGRVQRRMAPLYSFILDIDSLKRSFRAAYISVND